jgi:uncharacterized protein YjbI with pentapeptide repeats
VNREETLALLNGGPECVAEWNRRRESDEQIPDLSTANLARANLSEADLMGANLERAELMGANLRGANLCVARLIRADLRGTKLGGADLRGAKLSGADLVGAELTRADLSEADLRGADLRGADLVGADLVGADLSRANLAGADLRGADLRGADLVGANLRGANLIVADLRVADLSEADLTDAQLSGARLMDAVSVVFGTRSPQGLVKALARRAALRFREFVDRRFRAADPVDCSVFAPPSVVKGGWLIVQVIAHRPDQTKKARNLAAEVDEQARRRGFHSLEIEIERGTKLGVHLRLAGIECDTPIQAILWLGRPAYAVLKARVPHNAAIEIAAGSVTVSKEGVPLGSITFKVRILSDRIQPTARAPLLPAGEKARRYKRAFISYASPDRPDVLTRVQMLRVARIRYFQDVLKLEPGDRWERKLYHHIDRSDLFLLFWSTRAKESEWVLKEVRYAIKRKVGDDSAPPDVIPVIMESSPVPVPPPDLAHLHFNDYLIYFNKPEDSTPERTKPGRCLWLARNRQLRLV